MPTPRFDLIEDRRSIIDRRALADRIAGSPDAMDAILRDALADGRAEVERRLALAPSRGRMAAACTAFLADQLVRLAFDAAAGLVWAKLMADGTAAGRPRSALDMIIAAVALANDCVVVTDNERHFAGLDFVNPLRSAL